jgi:hypothetical protein
MGRAAVNTISTENDIYHKGIIIGSIFDTRVYIKSDLLISDLILFTYLRKNTSPTMA